MLEGTEEKADHRPGLNSAHVSRTASEAEGRWQVPSRGFVQSTQGSVSTVSQRRVED
jgi:hypothetical protein